MCRSQGKGKGRSWESVARVLRASLRRFALVTRSFKRTKVNFTFVNGTRVAPVQLHRDSFTSGQFRDER